MHHGGRAAVQVKKKAGVGVHGEVHFAQLPQLQLLLLGHGAQAPHGRDWPRAQGHGHRPVPRAPPKREFRELLARPCCCVTRRGVAVAGVEEPVVDGLVHGHGRRAVGAEPRHLVVAPRDGRQVPAQALARADRRPGAEHGFVPVARHHLVLVLLPKAVPNRAPREPVVVVKTQRRGERLLKEHQVGLHGAHCVRGLWVALQVFKRRALKHRVLHVAHQHPPFALGAALDPPKRHLIASPLKHQVVVVLRARCANELSAAAAHAAASLPLRPRGHLSSFAVWS
mmetsp:Transcript_28172/g.57746  ORF Transcript_28172/g.57746 Transcript_28172/m.57746 type:complete len:283 (-) Transcript_28172:769-1617(-)